MAKLTRTGRRVQEKENETWEKLVAPELNAIEEQFQEALFDDTERTYRQIFTEYALIWQKKVRYWNHRFKLLSGDELAFFKKYFPKENMRAA